ncbi:hypothetical protein [Mediterraneibacter gnavus]|nr:hypothetical protein [Mediterraneibacter gnavus]RGW19122.1 hypothetical protein DWV82_15450 [Mediterraneibacter gnavus]
MNIYKVIFYYIGIIVVFIIFVKMTYEFVTKKYKKKLSNKNLSKNPKIKCFQMCFWLIGICFSGLCVFTIGISGMKDLPFVLKNQYPYAIGKIVEINKTSHGDFSIIVEDEITNKKIDIGFLHKDLKEGEKVEVYYLPHLKIGSVYKLEN